MPLSRFQLRNEYGLGKPDLYTESSRVEDPKGVLDGIAVAGLVGLLRQIGDLTEFAAEVFHGLQEEVATTASRNRNLTTRMKRVEAALSPLEKAMLSQTSHLHFAYTPGSEWHVHIKNEQNQFIHTDLPRCIMDSYEESREPPCLQLLDRFDASGPGSCLKRYSDPTFFRRASGNFVTPNDGKSKKGRKGHKVKKRKSWKQNRQLSHDASNVGSSGRLQFSSPTRQRQSSPTQTVSTFDMTFKSDLADQSDSLDSGDGMGCIESAFRPSALTQTYETRTNLSLCGSKYPEEQTVNDGTPRSSAPDKSSGSLSVANCDDKAETFEPMVLKSDVEEIRSLPKPSADPGSQKMKPLVWKSANDAVQEVKEANTELDEPDIKPKGLNSMGYQNSEVQKANLEAEDTNVQPIHQISWSYEIAELHEKSFEDDVREMKTGHTFAGHKTSQVHDAFLQNYGQRLDEEIGRRGSVVPTPAEGVEEFPNLTLNKNQLDEVESETDNFVDALNTIESESENDLEYQTKGEVGLSLHPNHLEDDVNDQMTGSMGDRSIVSESPSTSYHDSGKRNSSTLYAASSLVSTRKKYFPRTHESRDDSGREPNGIPETSLSSMHSLRDVDGSKQEFAGGEFFSSELEQASMMIWTDEGFVRPPYISDQSYVKSCGTRSTALWSNGGLLGLQPSKPPVGSTSNGVNTDDSTTASPLYQNLRSTDDHLQGKLSTSGCNTRCDFGDNGFKQPFLFSGSHEVDYSEKLLQISNSVSDGKLNGSFGSSNSQGQLVPSLMHPEGKPHSSSDVGDSSDVAVHVNEARPSLLSGLTHYPPMKGFRKNRSTECGETPKTVGLLKTRDLKNGPHVALYRSPSGVDVTDSAPPSPPIEHMKLSFHPINNSDTSKLELKYPEEIDDNDDGDDDETLNLYPSCELVPKRTVQQILDSDSDDDTFCRSNPCKSDDDDDNHSHPSESISELWESGYSSESKDHETHSGLQRISSGESISSSLDHEHTENMSIHNGFGSSHAQHEKGLSCASSKSLPEIPVSRATNSLDLQQTRVSYNPNSPMMPFDIPEIAPGTPPLPPLQWRLSKPRSDVSEVKQSNMNLSHSQSMIISRDDPSDDGNELMNVNLRNKYMNEKLEVNTEEKVSQASEGERADEKGGDFLHQIRAKSFNLRKTGLLKPNPQPVTPATYDKLTAILEKANAIRQAVGSDDGEDDEPWSDT